MRFNIFKYVRQGSVAVLLLCACIFSVPSWPSPAFAVTCPTSSTVDTDGDGFTDAQECLGITFGGMGFGLCSGGARGLCVDPNSKDVFIYVFTPAGSIVLAQGMHVPGSSFYIFKDLAEPRAAGSASGKIQGLGLGVHAVFVSTLPSERNVPSGATVTLQQAILMIEDVLPSPVFGVADVGTLSDTGNGSVFTQAIKDYVKLLTGSDTDTQWKPYIQQSFAHEAGHMMALTAKDDVKIDHHYSTSSFVIMSESVAYASRTKTFKIPTDFSAGDNPCLLKVDVSNPLNCIAFPPPPIIIN